MRFIDALSFRLDSDLACRLAFLEDAAMRHLESAGAFAAQSTTAGFERAAECAHLAAVDYSQIEAHASAGGVPCVARVAQSCARTAVSLQRSYAAVARSHRTIRGEA